MLGDWDNLKSLESVVSRVGGTDFEVDWKFSRLEPDERMLASFQVCAERVSPSMTDEDWQGIRGHSAVAYVLSPPIRKDLAESISGRMLLLTAALVHEGGLAAKAESAGIGHGRARWLE
ncbi:MAG TPA: hypothetical protein VKE94_01025, partial [Gemmataceae bacterium]|nr:hypothetical protein [Gemmataceae bacterium]